METYADKIRERVEQRRLWLLIPVRRDAYVPVFEGTFPEALVEASMHAGFWKTTTRLYEADPHHPRQAGGTKELWAVVDVPRESPLREGSSE